MNDRSASERRELGSYRLGYALALVLTGAAFALIRWRWFGARATLALVLLLGLVQVVVHFRYFLHITLARSSRDDLRMILFAVVIILLMVGGSLVILMNLRQRMM